MSDKYSEYYVIQEETLTDVTDKVKYWMRSGWQPLGGIVLGETYGRYITSNYYLQTMVR